LVQDRGGAEFFQDNWIPHRFYYIMGRRQRCWIPHLILYGLWVVQRCGIPHRFYHILVRRPALRDSASILSYFGASSSVAGFRIDFILFWCVVQRCWIPHRFYPILVRRKSEARRACPGEAFRRRRNLEPKSYF